MRGLSVFLKLSHVRHSVHQLENMPASHRRIVLTSWLLQTRNSATVRVMPLLPIARSQSDARSEVHHEAERPGVKVLLCVEITVAPFFAGTWIIQNASYSQRKPLWSHLSQLATPPLFLVDVHKSSVCSQ